jgi:hypothetical protein
MKLYELYVTAINGTTNTDEFVPSKDRGVTLIDPLLQLGNTDGPNSLYTYIMSAPRLAQSRLSNWFSLFDSEFCFGEGAPLNR